jgi:hypothetical protein
MAVPGEVGRALAGAGGGIGVGRGRAERLAGAEHAAVVDLAHDHVAGRQVDQDLGPGEGAQRAGRGGDPEVLADLDVEGEAGWAGGLEQQVAAEGDGEAGDGDLAVVDLRARA